MPGSQAQKENKIILYKQTSLFWVDEQSLSYLFIIIIFIHILFISKLCKNLFFEMLYALIWMSKNAMWYINLLLYTIYFDAVIDNDNMYINVMNVFL